MRVFLDANVLFSASKAGRNIARLVGRLLAEATGVTRDLSREAARRNLAMKRADWLPAFEPLMANVEGMPSAPFGRPLSLDENDRAVRSDGRGLGSLGRGPEAIGSDRDRIRPGRARMGMVAKKR